MDLTPIRIRGRRRKHPASLLAAQLQASTKLSTQKQQRKIRKTKQAVAAMPTLQGLPLELLEIVFLYSMNTALPRCSPTLGRKLSSSTVIMDFTMQAFFHTLDHQTCRRDRVKTSDPKLQSDLLACRFFTWDFFLKYVEHAQGAIIKMRGKAWENTGVELPGLRNFDGLLPFQFIQVTYLGFAEGFYVPEKVLHGPWSTQKANLLYVLVSLNGEIDWAGSLSGETAKSGMREAIKEGNEHAVAALAVLLGVPKLITTEMLRYAVLQCGCNINVVRHLLFNAQILARYSLMDALDFHDPKLWAWAEANDEKGVVVKKMLKKADAFDLEFYFESDADWKKTVSFPYGGIMFDTRTTFREVVRELLINLYKNYGRKITRRRRTRVQGVDELD
jgi:hypothetical protein